MNPLYHQFFGVIGVILVLGSLGILRAMEERLHREASSFRGRMEMLGLGNEEEALRRAEEIRRRRSGTPTEDAAQHDLEHK